MKNKPILIIMTGLARCGKSTWISKNKGNAVIVCPDDIRAKVFGHQFHIDAEEFIWAFTNAIIKLLLDQGKSVIVDATSINEFSRDKLIRIARQRKLKIRIVWLKTSVKECKRRNAKSPEGKKVPDEVIDRMARGFEDPIYDAVSEKDVEVIEIPKDGYKRVRMGNYYFDSHWMDSNGKERHVMIRR
jgi:predicted kinase